MIPINFPQSNKTLLKPPGMTDQECISLLVWTDGKVCLSCWRLTWRERLRLLFTGRVWLWIVSGQTQPPVMLEVKNPFPKRKEDK